MEVLFILVCLFFTPTFTLFAPMTHKIFRNTSVYFYFMLFSFSLVVIFIFKLNTLANSDKTLYLASCLSPITFLLLYKLFNKIINLKYGRPIYFYVNYISYKDGESENATGIERVLQMILLIIPGFLYYIGSLLF